MAGITLEEAEEQLAAWLNASKEIAANQSVTIGDKTLTKASAAWIEKQVIFWDRQVKRLTRGGIRVTLGTPCN